MSIQVLEARAAIADLIHTYAKNVREGKGSACSQLFSDDAVFEVRNASSFGSAIYTTRSTVVGRDAIAARIGQSASPEAPVCPSISNLIIEVNGTEASSSCVMTILGTLGGSQTLGEYADSYRDDGGWRFTSRIFTIVSGT